MKLGDNLKRLRRDNNMSQEQLAEMLNVSRQSVSKWESDISYPEMEKMLQICKIFNINIDELLNQDIKEVNSTKESKNNINNFIDSALSYVTKTVDVFSSMKFKEKIKCIFEQLILTFILVIIFLILGSILHVALENIVKSFSLYNQVMDVMFAIYLVLSLLISSIIILHIFKIRYLDYYEVINNVDTKEYEVRVNDNDISNTNKILLEKKKEKIIIRDESDSKYGFISNLFKIFLFSIKVLVVFLLMGLTLSLIIQIILFVISFLFIKTGVSFIGFIISLISLITLNIVFIIMSYNFIISHKNKLRKLSIISLISIIVLGLGIGIFITSLKDFEIIEQYNPRTYITETINIDMTDDIRFDNYYDIEFEESDIDNIEVILSYNKYSKVKLEHFRSSSSKNEYTINFIDNYNNKYSKELISMINNKKIYIDYGYTMKVRTNKTNIDKIIDNQKKYEKQEYDDELFNLRKENERLNEENEYFKEKIYECTTDDIYNN